MLQNSCDEFLKELASKSPVPGGGGASALVGAIGIALGSMVGNLTTGKKKYANVEADIQQLLLESEALMRKMSRLVQADADVFEPLSKAYGLPSETDKEKTEKDRVVQEVLVQATTVPLEIAECSVAGLRLLSEYAKKGSRLVVSDAGVGAIFCKSALQGAKLNVLINLKLMKDESLKKEFSKRLQIIEKEGLPLADEIYQYVEGELCC